VNYSAKKIYLNCDEHIVRDWADFMRHHQDEIVRSLTQENVRHEMWFMGRDDALYVIGVMDVDDLAASSKIAVQSALEVDKVHRAFKAHWNRDHIETLTIDPSRAPNFANSELLFEARTEPSQARKE